MAIYNNTNVGYGQQYDVDLRDQVYTDMNMWWGWQSEFYVLGYVLNIERADKVNGLTVDKDWEKYEIYEEVTDEE